MVIIVQFKSNWPTTILVSSVWSREAIVHKKYISSLAQKLLQKNSALLHLKKQSEEEKRIRQKIKSHCTASGYYGTWCKYPAFFKFLARPSLQKIDHSKIKQYGRQIDSKEGISQYTHTRISQHTHRPSKDSPHTASRSPAIRCCTTQNPNFVAYGNQN